jgi:hypothetical protein
LLTKLLKFLRLDYNGYQGSKTIKKAEHRCKFGINFAYVNA